MENVNKVPEAKHIITPECNFKLNDFLKNDFLKNDESGDGEDFIYKDFTGKTLKEAAKIAGEGFNDETLMHFIEVLFPEKYQIEY